MTAEIRDLANSVRLAMSVRESWRWVRSKHTTSSWAEERWGKEGLNAALRTSKAESFNKSEIHILKIASEGNQLIAGCQ